MMKPFVVAWSVFSILSGYVLCLVGLFDIHPGLFSIGLGASLVYMGVFGLKVFDNDKAKTQ